MLTTNHFGQIGYCRLLRMALLITFWSIASEAQISINKPILGFTEVCASSTFNTFSLNFTFSPVANLGASNVFNVELSDANGNFASPVLLTTATATTSPVAITFSMPTTINGAGYKIRIKSTSPVSMSPSSDPFAASYAVFNQSYTINNNVSSQNFCVGNSYTLSIDSGATSPLQYPQLIYKWYKNNVVIPGQTSSSLVVNTAGNYYCRVDYGTCSLNAYSNVVTMNAVPVESITISSQNNVTQLCSSLGIVLSSSNTASSNTFQWNLNNSPIAGATSATYVATQPGNYSLQITNNPCITPSNTLTLTASNYSVSLNSGASLTLLPGQNYTLTSTTTAINPTYKWYKNNVLQSGATTPNLTVSQAGTYKLVVQENTSCISEKDATTVVSYPTNYNLTIAANSTYNECVSLNTALNINSFTANSSALNVLTSAVPVTYKWYKNNALVTGATLPTLAIPNFQENGLYKLVATLADGTTVTSNDVNIKLNLNQNLQITSTGMLCTQNPSIAVTPSILNNQFTYTWYKVGTTNAIGNAMVMNATIPGDYYVKISYLGCDVNSNTVSVNALDEAMLLTNYDGAIEINEGEQITITASGADAYLWAINSVSGGTADHLMVNQAQTITLTGYFGACSVTKNFVVTVKPKPTNVFIPNTITPNSDGKNDTWVIPNDYAYKEDVEVVIFNSNQEILYKSTNYNNDWPSEEVVGNRVYYYKISKENTVLEQGTISVIKK